MSVIGRTQPKCSEVCIHSLSIGGTPILSIFDFVNDFFHLNLPDIFGSLNEMYLCGYPKIFILKFRKMFLKSKVFPEVVKISLNDLIWQGTRLEAAFP
jgi:hypothetical protein